jgi:hypothetical protein
MNPDNVPERHGKKAVGVILAQVILEGKRQAA